MGSTSCPGTLVLGSEGPRGRTALPGVSGPGLKALGVDQLSRATRACVRFPGMSIRCLWRIAPESECPSGPPGLLGHSGPCQSARGVFQVFRVTRARVRRPVVSTNSPGHLGFLSEISRSTCCPGLLGPMNDVPLGLSDIPGESGLCRRDRAFDQISQPTRTLVRGAVVLKTYPGRPLPCSS